MASSRSGSDSPKGWILPAKLRNSLKITVGKVLTGRELMEEIEGREFVVTVGDIVTLELLEHGRVPDLSIVDYQTQRMPLEEVKKRFERFEQPELKVKNPAGEITLELWKAIKDGYENPRNLRIVVEGEEDLAALACISLAPENTTVIYGIPNRGATVLHVDLELKSLVDDILEQMET